MVPVVPPVEVFLSPGPKLLGLLQLRNVQLVAHVEDLLVGLKRPGLGGLEVGFNKYTIFVALTGPERSQAAALGS